MAIERRSGEPAPRLYEDLASWWPLLSPPSEYVDEAADLLPRLRDAARAPAMLAVCRELNPECEHLMGDMRSLRLDREFDMVLIHDAIMYATDQAAVRATIRTAAIHCRPGGTVVILPDHVRETFAPETDHGGHDAVDGRGLRYLEWSWDPDPTDDTYTVDYAFLLRAGDGTVRVEHDRHVEGLFGRAQWLQWLAEAGLPAHAEGDPWGREVFIATRSGAAWQRPRP